MIAFHLPVRRPILATGFVAAIAAAPAVAILAVSTPSTSMPVAECPPGLVAEVATGACIAAPVGNTPESIPGNPNLPAVDGIPCTGANTGECIGLQESQGGGHMPRP
jgi:hypothetical protein